MLRYPILSLRSKEFLTRQFIQKQIKNAWIILTEDPAYATPNLSTWFRKNRSLGSRDRKIVSEVLFILIRFQHSFSKLGLQELDEIFELLQHDSWPEITDPSIEDIACFLSLDPAIIQEWSQALSKSELIILSNHLQSRAPIDIRINPRKTSREQQIRLLREKNITAQIIENTALGIRIEQRANLQGLQSYRNGAFEIQDAASQIFCQAIPISSKASVLDMCSGAGGKSLTLKALYPELTIFAQEPRSNARKELQKRAQRAGVVIAQSWPIKPVDIVIIDAPCSGLGRLRREPTLRFRWQQQSIKQFITVQQQLLKQAQSYVNKSGVIVYATCSLLDAENTHDLEGWQRDTTLIWPHQQNCDGFGYSIYTRK